MSIEKCIICGCSETSVLVHLHSNNLIALKCKNCSHIYVNNSPINADNISEYYTMEDFKGKRTLQEFEYSNYYSDCFVDYNQKNESSLVLMQFKEKANYFDSLLPKGSKILDVGCATGVFLDMMRKFEWEVEGVEVSNELASYAHEKFNLKVHVRDITKENLNSGPFQVITMFDVIEHVVNPVEVIEAIHEHLNPGGIALIYTPNLESLAIHYLKEYSSSVIPVHHPFIFHKKSLCVGDSSTIDCKRMNVSPDVQFGVYFLNTPEPMNKSIEILRNKTSVFYYRNNGGFRTMDLVTKSGMHFV